jgi:MtrB/PioB family decaheme-associated outer membrane protein
MRNRNLILSLAVAGALATVAARADNAAGVDTSDWKCESCPFQKEYEAEVEAGVLYVDDDSAKFGEYNGLNEKGAYADVGARGGGRSEAGSYYDYTVDGVGVDPEAEVVFGKEGLYEASLTYDTIPHEVWDTTVTPYSRAGSGAVELPSGWVRANSTSGMTSLDGSLRDVDLGTERTKYGAGLGFLLGSGLELFADYSREDVEGRKLGSANFLFSSLQFPEEVDSSHDQFELGARYRWKGGFVRLAWFGSVYDNGLSGLTFENPYIPIPGDTVQGRKAAAPDNKAYTYSLDGNFLLPWWEGVISYRLAEGSMDQDESFLPFSTSADLSSAVVLPRANLGGGVDTKHYRAALSLKPFSRLRARFGYRYDERDDGTRPYFAGFVESDSYPVPGRDSLRYDYERTRYDGYGEVRVFDWLFLGVGGEFDEVDRTYQAAKRTTEEGSYAQLRMRPWGTVELSARYGESHLEADENPAYQGVVGENPLLAKFNQSNRDRDYAEARIAWSPWKLAIALEGTYAFDAYRLSPLGLQSGRDYRYAGTVSWAVADDVSVYLAGSYQNIATEQLGEEAYPTTSNPWAVSHEDEFTTAGGGVVWKDVAGKVDLALDYTWAKSEGAIETMAVPSSASGAFPRLQTELNSLRVSASYDVSDRLSVGVAWTWEDYDSSDWQIGGVEPATVTNLLSMSPDPYDYSVNVIGVSFSYRFGGPKGEDAEE